MTDHDTETRLRDYLHTKAQVVPDHATPPAPVADLNRGRRTWPALAAAASIAAVLALAATYLGSNDPPVSSGGGLSSLKVPYVVAEGSASRTLHDGTTTIQLGNSPAHGVLGRLATGWLVITFETDAARGGTMQHAVLTKDGRLRPVGSRASQGAVLSPDHTQAASLVRVSDSSFKIEVVDLATGNEIAVLPLPSNVYLQGWNKHGIWYDEEAAGNPRLWRPGEQSRQVEIPGFEGMTAPGTTDRMAIQTQQGGTRCVKVMTMDASGDLTTLRENCESDSTAYPELSPDGKVLVIPKLKVAVNVDSGQQTPLPDLPQQASLGGLVFEDERTVLAMVSVGVAADPPRTTPTKGLRTHDLLTRCDVVTGTCEKLFEKLPDTDYPTVGIARP